MNKKRIDILKLVLFIFSIIGIMSYISYFITKDFVVILEDELELIIPRLVRSNIYFNDRVGGLGRLCPLQFFDYYLLKLINIEKYNSVMFQWFIIFKLFLITFLFIKILFDMNKFLNIKKNLLIMFFTFLFFLSFKESFKVTFEIKYTELSQIIFVLLFILFYQKAYFTNKLSYYILAFLFAVYASYMKETMFVPFFTIGVCDLFFNKKSQNEKFLKSRRKLFDLSLIFSGFVFLLLYFCIVFLNTDEFYNNFVIYHEFYWCLTDVFMILLFILPLFKIKKVFKRQLNYEDYFLFAGIGYSMAICLLKLGEIFYHIISYTFFVIYIYNLFITTENKYIKTLIPIMCLLISAQGISCNKNTYKYYLQPRRTSTIEFNNYINQSTKIASIAFVEDSQLIYLVDLYEYYNIIMQQNKHFAFINYKDFKERDLNDYDIVFMPTFSENFDMVNNNSKLTKFELPLFWGYATAYKVNKNIK